MFASCIYTCTILAFTFTTAIAIASAAGSRGAGTNNYEDLRTCLLSWAVPRSQILSRDDPLDAECYSAVNWQWNSLNGTITPLVYLEARHDQDVAAAVRCCTGLGFRIVAKGGGHSYVKHGFGDSESLIVDLHLLNTVEVDAQTETGTIGAGTRQGKILADLWAAGGWVVPAGNCPTVGFAGYALGGGYGSYTRWLGLASDRLLEVTLVDSRGVILTVNNGTDPELFWALRGGGGGNFGIVTRMKMRLSQAPAHVIQAVTWYNWDQFPGWLRSWQTWLRSEPPSHLLAVSLFNATGFRTRFMSMGGSEAEMVALINGTFPPPERLVSFDQFSFPEFVVDRASGYWPAGASEPFTNISQLVNLTRHNAPGWKRVKSLFVDLELVTDEEINALQTLFMNLVGIQYTALSIEQQGGAISTMAPTDTAYVHRGSRLFGVQLQAFVPNGQDEPEEAVAAIERFFDESKTLWNHTASYQNYLDSTMGDYLERYYGANLERLVSVKARIDPNNVFHHPKSIPVRLH